MKILQVHNFYQIRGGEATVVEQEKQMLEEQGHEVVTWYKDNKEIDQWDVLKKARLIFKTAGSSSSANQFKTLLEQHQPDICHIHNFFPLITPAIFSVCKKFKVPVVQTLHNYRLMCANGILFRDGMPCEKCVGDNAYKSVLNRCYRKSVAQTFAVSHMLENNKKKGTWTDEIDAYICLTDFAKSKFIEHGFPAEKLHVKSNFLVEVSKERSNSNAHRPFFAFVGRLSEEKGIELLIDLAEKSPLPIKVFGEGPAQGKLENKSNLLCQGKVEHTVLQNELGKANALLFPSQWYEGMPMTIIEAFANQIPVLANNLGAMSTLIETGVTGFLIETNNQREWLAKMNALTDQELVKQMGQNARQEFEQKYTKFTNYERLMEIYQKVIIE